MNTDWNSPQGDFDTAEKQGELLMLLSRQQVTVHTWDDPDFDYMEEQDLALVVQSPSGTEDLLIELCGEFSVFFEKWHGEYAATAEGYAQLQQDITAILDGKAGALSLYTENGWQGTVLCTELPGAEDAAAALKRCWQAAKPDAVYGIKNTIIMIAAMQDRMFFLSRKRREKNCGRVNESVLWV